MHEVYQLVRIIQKKPRRASRASGKIKDKSGRILTTKGEVLSRWQEYYLNLVGVDIDCTDKFKFIPDDYQHYLAQPTKNVDTSEPTLQDIRRAIAKLKNGKAGGFDQVLPEMLKYLNSDHPLFIDYVCGIQEWFLNLGKNV